ncbi:hypothetical protein HCC61_08120 [Streptomyces sp. HNM0575]|uniref:hypothetical protein n=1 Tax=Streptomyces sp. HNM0575 TaxID=2716338 RepID=UPI00145C3C8C|nr:hypothetical protein [Streptomyces sp. HNM0575]NLU72637.1 hypothetical protein [Streptomyces sp. HNM0575]
MNVLTRALGRLVHTPMLVLLTAAVLPGVGHVVIGRPFRGLTFVFYILLLGIITAHLAAPDRSFLGTYAGGVFVYAISVMDAYRLAALDRTRAARR